MHNKANKSAWQGNEPELEGKHIWTREASEKPCSLSSGTQPEIAATESLRFRSSQNGKNELPHSEYLQPNSARTTVCSGIRSLNLGEIIETEATNSSKSYGKILQ